MEYRFKSKFDRSKEYIIETNEPLELYDVFALSIKKFDNNDKSFSNDNIDCVLKYSKKGVLDTKTIELDYSNFNGFYMLIETFRHRGCLSMGEPLDMIYEKKVNEYENVNLSNADEELKLAFNDYIEKHNIMDILFKTFLAGVSYGKNKTYK